MITQRPVLWKAPAGMALWGLGAAVWAQCAGTASVPGASAAQIVALAGQGQTRAPGTDPWSPAVLAQQLAPGADVRTLALSSAALLLADRTQIRMSANAQLRLCESQPARTLLELAAGRLWARTKKAPAALQLQTPAALAVVRGTDWDVEVDAAGRTTLTVLSGLVELSNPLGSVQLGPSEQGSVEPGQAPVKRQLVRPRERVQWVTAYPVGAARWAEGGAAEDLVLADREVAGGQLDAAQARLERAWLHTQDPRAAARRAELLMVQDRAADARAWLDATRAAAPASVELLLADADWQRLEGHGDGALALYREAVDRAEGPAQQAAAHWGLGRALQERGDLHAARAALARAVELVPDNPTYRGEQATAAAQALRLPEAHTGFDAALGLAGDDYVSLAGSGLLALKQGDPEAARAQLLKALVIEPRYAQAHVWLAVAEYQLGGDVAAFDSLERARLADPNDPLPWQVESILRNDSGEPGTAIAAAREALARLPHLKSMNPLASDSQGSANLGKALGDFGLEHWARAYAQQSYYPLWAGSHFFLANRYESGFSRNSELHQGYLADPLAFGAGERRAVVLPAEGREVVWAASAERGPEQVKGVGDVVLRGLDASALPMAWYARANGLRMWPRSGRDSYWMKAPSLDLAWGARPTDRLGVFVVHNRAQDRVGYPGGADYGNGTVLNSDIDTRSTQTDAGGSWRWSADAQTWFQWSRLRRINRRMMIVPPWGDQAYDLDYGADAAMLRHVIDTGAQRLSFGWERASAYTGSLLKDPGEPWEASYVRTTARFDMPWVAGEWQAGAWAWQLGAFWPRMQVRTLDRYYDQVTGQDLGPVLEDRDGGGRRLRPRAGLSYRFGPGRALHAAYIESLYAPSSHTLAPVAVGAIPIDYQYQRLGSSARKSALQLDWEVDARTFAWGMASRQHIENPAHADGSLVLPDLNLDYADRAGVLAPWAASGQTAIDPFNGSTAFSQGDISQAGVALNRVVLPRWSLLGSYTWADSRNTSSLYAGNALPGVPRHTVVVGSVWRHAGRGLTQTSLVYRGTRFADEANTWRQGAGWNFNLLLFRESADRRWAWTATLQTPLHGTVRPTLWAGIRYRVD